MLNVTVLAFFPEKTKLVILSVRPLVSNFIIVMYFKMYTLDSFCHSPIYYSMKDPKFFPHTSSTFANILTLVVSNITPLDFISYCFCNYKVAFFYL